MQHWYALVVFAALSTITPGPNNLMIMASSINFGVRKSLPHFLGITTGFPLMVMAVGFGLSGLLEQHVWFNSALLLLSATMMLYLAWRTATFEPAPEPGKPPARPLRYIEAVLFQWVNPKAWLMATGVMALFPAPGEGMLLHLLGTAIVMCGVGVFCVGAWLVLGVQLRGFVQSPVRLRVFNGLMAVALLGFFAYSLVLSL